MLTFPALGAAENALFEAIKNNDMNALLAIIAPSNPIKVNINVAQGDKTPLGLAAYLGREEFVNILLVAGANPNVEHLFVTPLIWGVRRGNLAIVRALLNMGGNANGGLSMKPLKIAYDHGHVQVMQLFLDHQAFFYAPYSSQWAIAHENPQQLFMRKSVSQAITALKAYYTYRNADIDKARRECYSWIASLDDSDDSNNNNDDDEIAQQPRKTDPLKRWQMHIAKQAMIRLKFQHFSDPYTSTDIQEVIGLVWLAINDFSYHAPVSSAQAEQTRQNYYRHSLISFLAKMQRGYNGNSYGMDNGQSVNIPINTMQHFHTFMEAINGKHPCVRIVFVNPFHVLRKAISLLEMLFRDLPDAEKRSFAKDFETPTTTPTAFLNAIMPTLEVQLRNEFAAYQGDLVDYEGMMNAVKIKLRNMPSYAALRNWYQHNNLIPPLVPAFTMQSSTSLVASSSSTSIAESSSSTSIGESTSSTSIAESTSSTVAAAASSTSTRARAKGISGIYQ